MHHIMAMKSLFRIILKFIKIIIFFPIIVGTFSKTFDFDAFEEDVKSLFSDESQHFLYFQQRIISIIKNSILNRQSQITQSRQQNNLWIIPQMYPVKIRQEKAKLFPSTHFALYVLYAAIGQLIPKHTIIPASNILIIFPLNVL